MVNIGQTCIQIREKLKISWNIVTVSENVWIFGTSSAGRFGDWITPYSTFKSVWAHTELLRMSIFGHFTCNTVFVLFFIVFRNCEGAGRYKSNWIGVFSVCNQHINININLICDLNGRINTLTTFVTFQIYWCAPASHSDNDLQTGRCLPGWQAFDIASAMFCRHNGINA